jgi:acetylornithine deacetylase
MIAEIAAQTQQAICGDRRRADSMKVVSGHKGVRSFIVEVIGREAHSSLPDQGVSAVMEAMKLMSLVADMGARRAAPHTRTSIRQVRR